MEGGWCCHGNAVAGPANTEIASTGVAVEAVEAGDTATDDAFICAVDIALAGNTGINGIAAAIYAADA